MSVFIVGFPGAVASRVAELIAATHGEKVVLLVAPNHRRLAKRFVKKVDGNIVIAEGRDGVPEGFAHAHRQHEGRLADGFAAVDDTVFGGLGQERHPEVVGALAEGGQLVGARTEGTENAVVVPDELFAREPAEPLGEGGLAAAQIAMEQKNQTAVQSPADGTAQGNGLVG